MRSGFSLCVLLNLLRRQWVGEVIDSCPWWLARAVCLAVHCSGRTQDQLRGAQPAATGSGKLRPPLAHPKTAPEMRDRFAPAGEVTIFQANPSAPHCRASPRLTAASTWYSLPGTHEAAGDRVPPRGVAAALLGRDELPIRLPVLAS